MSTDLYGALQEIADECEAVATAPREEVLVSRLRSARAARRVARSAVGVAAAAALVVGGAVLVDRWPAPVPPAETTPPPAPTQEPTPAPEPEPTTEPEPEPDPEADLPEETEQPVPDSGEDPPEAGPPVRPALEDLVVTTSGLGPLRLGPMPTDGPAALMVRLEPDVCPDDQLGQPDRLHSTYDDEPRAFALNGADDGVISWILVSHPALRTAEGVGVGTTLVDLRATYPGLEGPADPTYGSGLSRLWWLSGPDGTLVLETTTAAWDDPAVEQEEYVIAMHVLAPDRDLLLVATAFTDNVPDYC